MRFVVRLLQVTLMRPPFLMRLTYSPTRIFFEPRRRYSRSRTRRVFEGTLNLTRRPWRRTSRTEIRLWRLTRRTDGAGRLRDGPLPFDGGRPATGALLPGTTRFDRSPISDGCAVQLSPGSGLIRQAGSDIAPISPHKPAPVEGRRL